MLLNFTPLEGTMSKRKERISSCPTLRPEPFNSWCVTILKSANMYRNRASYVYETCTESPVHLILRHLLAGTEALWLQAPVCILMSICLYYVTLTYCFEHDYPRCLKLHISYFPYFDFKMAFCTISIENKISSFLKQLPKNTADKKLHFLLKCFSSS